MDIMTPGKEGLPWDEAKKSGRNHTLDNSTAFERLPDEIIEQSVRDSGCAPHAVANMQLPESYI